MNPQRGALPAEARDVLDFWFGPADAPDYGVFREAWFEKNPAFDDSIRRRFGHLWQAAARGGFADWRAGVESCQALIIVLDQFPRNLHRGSPNAFATDARAREVARHAIASGYDSRLSIEERLFVYLPFEHSEILEDQHLSVSLFEGLTGEPLRATSIESARRHREIIMRFGRFPHRNAALGRATTPEEAAFLLEPNSSF